MSVSGLEKLDVWCKARDFAVRVHKEILPLLPLEEKWSPIRLDVHRRVFLQTFPKGMDAFTFRTMSGFAILPVAHLKKR